ncbi:MAG: S-methyl-5'-thioadenosine phosphorylase [Candidatus Buchananbacteria bacterium]
MTKNLQAEIGIFGGSGFYDLLENPEIVVVKTEWGEPSAKIHLGKIAGQSVAFLPRHGEKHTIPPHKINYRANLAAFKQLGVKHIISPCAAGSLQPDIKPGDFVVLDQFVDRTVGREDSFYQGPQVTHVAGAKPYCPQLADLAVKTCQELKIAVHPQGTVVVINGPRFSTTAESRWFASHGWQVINMTQYPEVILAKEQAIGFCGLALITDYDAGLAGVPGIEPVTLEEVMKVFKVNNEKVKTLIYEMIKNWPTEFKCDCDKSLAGAVVN